MNRSLVLLLIAALLFSCKKKKDAEEPEPTTPTPPAKTISVKVDGVEKSCSSCYSGSKSGGLRSSYFYLSGTNEEIYFSYGPVPAPGTYTLVKFQDPTLIYIKNNTYYRAVSGTLTISSIDTSSSGVVNKIVASFNFKTDTTSGVFFNITDGSINLK
jgi:hypothetical protein